MSDNKSFGSITVDVDLDTTAIQKKMKVIGEGVLRMAQALEALDEATNEMHLRSYSNEVLLCELERRGTNVKATAAEKQILSTEFVLDNKVSVRIKGIQKEKE